MVLASYRPGMTYDVVVVGAGLAGSAAAWSLSRRGRSVLLLEQLAPAHEHGSSHGTARIVRRAYGDGLYVGLTGQAFELWRELEQASGRSLLRMLGGLDHGPERDLPRLAALLREHGVGAELMPGSEAARRWPGMRFDGDVLHHPQAGTVDAAGAVAALVDLARQHGAEVRAPARAVTVGLEGQVHLEDGSVVSAGAVVVAAGAWLGALLAPVVELPPLRVSRQTVAHFPRRDPAAPAWPSVIHERSDAAFYHLAGGPDGGDGEARKLGDHRGGAACTPALRGADVEAGALKRLSTYVEQWLPGLDPEPLSSTSCLYTETPSEDFVLDRVGRLVVCSPCSGHGAKFAPLVGELVAGLVDGRDDVPARFRLAQHRAGRAGAVSL